MSKKTIHPTPIECAEAVAALVGVHGVPDHSASKCVLDSLVRTMLSQNTTDITSKRAFEQLKEAFPTWEECYSASVEAIAAPIKCCGLADIRASRIKEMLGQIRSERGELSLEYVRKMEDEQVKKELTKFKGVGPKTAACVLMFCLGRSEFPVDVHVLRIAKSLKWVPQKFTRIQAYEHLNEVVPSELKFDLHCLLVRHGKHCRKCAKNGKPRLKPHVDCPLVNLASGLTKKRRVKVENMNCNIKVEDEEAKPEQAKKRRRRDRAVKKEKSI